MSQFIVITYRPQRQGFLGPIKEEIVISEVDARSVEEITNDMKVPLDGYAMVAEKTDITIVKSTIVNEIVPAKVET